MKIICIETGEVFNSLKLASIWLNTCPQNISAQLSGRTKRVKGLTFAYVDKTSKEDKQLLLEDKRVVLNIITKEVFNSVEEACKKYSIHPDFLLATLDYQYRRAGGFEWTYYYINK